LWDGIISKGVDDLIITTGQEQDEIPKDDKAHFDALNRILHLPCNDAYEGLPEKIVRMVDYVLHAHEFSHITHLIKIDDHDNVFHRKNIEHIATCVPELATHDYIGQKLQKCSGDRSYHRPRVDRDSPWAHKSYEGAFVPWLHGGSSYILSRRAMLCINDTFNLNNIESVTQSEIFEDVMIARILHERGIHPHEMSYGITLVPIYYGTP